MLDMKHNTLSSGDAFEPSFFKLQVDEMLAGVRLNCTKRKGSVDIALCKLKTIIESIQCQGPMNITEALVLMQKSYGIAIPFPDPGPGNDPPYKLLYSPPSGISIVGSYPLRTMTKTYHLPAVDMVVTMPASIFREKDFLNYSYFHKKAFYLACLAAGLQRSAGHEFECRFSHLGGNGLQPILLVKQVNNQSEFPSSICDIHIIPAAPHGVFEKKLHPRRNSVRSKVDSDIEVQTRLLDPTPFYNATLQADTNFAPYLKLLLQSSNQVKGFADCCVLGRIWLCQRGFGGSIASGGFGHFEWAALTALLLQGGGPKGECVLCSGYSSYQLFKATIHYLAHNNLAEKPVTFHAPGIAFPSTDMPIFYDGPRGQNILFKMTAWSYAMLLEEARISLETMNDVTSDQFEATFVVKKDHPLQQFDSLLQISTKMPAEEREDVDGASPVLRLCSAIYGVLQEGLTDRVKLIQIKVPDPAPWPLEGSQPPISCEMLVGVTFIPENVERVVDRGPAAEDKKAAIQFRKFWGEKAELRRFKDGSIRESCVWASGSALKDIVTYLMKRYFDKQILGHIKFFGGDFWSLLPDSNNVKYFFDLRESFNTFEQDIRGMESLPLQPKQLLATNSQLRQSSVQIPIFSPLNNLRDPVDIIVRFEGSGRWPDDIIAIQRTKIALLLKISSIIETAIKGLYTKLSLENLGQPLHNCAFLDIIYPSGAVFRARIQCDREQVLLDRLFKNDSIKSHPRNEILTAKSVYQRMYIQLPLHGQSIAINCTRYPVLSSTIRLVKKWFMSHLLYDHIGEELIELIVARSFLQPYPWRAPSSLNSGFLRTVQFISKWDWRTTPLVVDFSGTMTRKEVTTIKSRLEAWRKIDPGMNRVAIVAASNHDMTGTMFTDGSPSKVMAARMTALARSVITVVRQQEHKLKPKDLFNPSIVEYDFAIHISSRFTTDLIAEREAKTTQYKNMEMQNQKGLSAIGYEPIELFLNELTAIYSPNVIFFHDPLARSVITGLWSPQATSQILRVSTPRARKPEGDNAAGGSRALVDTNKRTLLSEIARLGGEMIARIDFYR